MPRIARDDFKQLVVQLLARRVGYRCSNPACRVATSGPDGDDRAVNLGVAAHITAAAPGGSRYDPTLSADARGSYENGIWLCQQCSRLIDVDEVTHGATLLREWKQFAESVAFLEVRGFDVVRGRNFATLEKKVPDLVAEMRADLIGKRFTRELIVLSKRMVYNPGAKAFFTYFFEDHEDLLSKLQICEHYSAIYDVTYNSVPRYNFSEDFVDYLLGEELS